MLFWKGVHENEKWKHEGGVLSSPSPSLQEKVTLAPSLVQDINICLVQGVLWLACSLSGARQMLSQILETKCVHLHCVNSQMEYQEHLKIMERGKTETENESKPQPTEKESINNLN